MIIAKFISIAALAGTILPPLLFLAGAVELDPVKLWMLASSVAWFAATPWWMKRS